MRFFHYSGQPLPEVLRASQDGSDHRGSKPNGLWLSIVGADGCDSWKDYCKAKHMTLGQHCTEIIFKDDAEILHVRFATDIDRLTNSHGYMPQSPAEFLKADPNYNRSAICWRRVAEEFDGIVITPECIERRQVSHWYYTWDCASGCIWHPNPVQALKPL